MNRKDAIDIFEMVLLGFAAALAAMLLGMVLFGIYHVFIH